MNAVEIDNLTYTYPGASQPTLNDISLQIAQGDFLAVVGNNGCGKSTLCKVLNGLIPHFITGDFAGRVKVGGLDTLESDVSLPAQKVGYVYQDFENQIVRPTVLDDASYACLNYAFPDYLDRGRAALKQCGLEGREGEYVWQLSGGQTHLLALAGAVSLQPDILILDEPIAQLDPMHADRIYGVLRELNETYGKTIIVIEHHTEYIADYCRHVMLMKDGQVQWMLPTDEALRRVEELEACNIFPPQVTRAAHRMRAAGKLAALAALPTTVEQGKAAFASLNHCPRPLARSGPAREEAVVAFQGVRLAYRSVKGAPREVFHDLNLEIHRGEKVALIGSNGAGKSTLMKLMVGLLRPGEGTVSLFGEPIGEKRAEDPLPPDLPGLSKPRGDVHQGLHPGGHRLCHAGPPGAPVGAADGGPAGPLPPHRPGPAGRPADVRRPDAPGQPGHRHRPGPGHPPAGRAHRQPGHRHPARRSCRCWRR